MALIRGTIPGDLARLLDIEGGRIQATDLRDGEGVSLVYDVGRMVAAQRLATFTRIIENQSYDDTGTQFQEWAGLPTMARLQHLEVTVNTPTNVEQIALILKDFDSPDTDMLLWHWTTGDSLILRPNLMDVTATSFTNLLHPSVNRLPLTFIDRAAQINRRGSFALWLWGEANAAVTFNLSAVLFGYHWIGALSGPGAPTPPVDVPSW